ncbi:unnamed protein product [Effrenium voratum]|nr:unnamed protein product [Effrenium voratum]
MAPVEAECGLCTETLWQPVTLPCGETFCQQCLRQWTITKLDEGMERPRCPCGCGRKLDYRLPSVNLLLRTLMEHSHAEQLAEREKEEREQEEPEILGGLSAWQEVAASQDLFVNGRMVVAWGTSGVVLCNHETTHVKCSGVGHGAACLSWPPGPGKVKFDACLSGSGTFNVSVGEIVPQLPSSFGFKIGQGVVAGLNLMIGDELVVAFGSPGTILAKSTLEGRIVVNFHCTVEGAERKLDVQAFELQPSHELLGGFRAAQRVQATQDILGPGEVVLVQAGTLGTVHSEYSDTRLVVSFESRLDGSPDAVNLCPQSIEPA